MSLSRFQEVGEELQSVVFGRHKILDSIVPPLVFVIINALAGLQVASIAALGTASIFTLYRLIKRQPVGYALGGIGGVLLAIGIALLSGRAEGFFLPQLLTSSLTALACLVSVFTRRPLVAYTSYLTRRWPITWYWHPQVRPAYSEVTLVWGVFFGLRALAQYVLIQGGELALVGFLNVLLGWPALILLLIFSYLYGMWRLRQLSGPSVQEYQDNTPPPWAGQTRGF